MPAEKRTTYNQMIQAGSFYTNGDGSQTFLNGALANTEKNITLPLPFFFSRDAGTSLPTAALPYNDMRIVFKTRQLTDLLSEAGLTGNSKQFTSATGSMTKAKLWANYALVTNDERVLMGAAPRDIVIEQHQMASAKSVAASGTTADIDIRFAHSIKAIFFGLRVAETDHTAGYTANVTPTPAGIGTAKTLGGMGQVGNCRSHYSMFDYVQHVYGSTYGIDGWKVLLETASTNSAHAAAAYAGRQVSPFTKVSLVYENTTRLGQMEPRFYEQIQPYYHGVSCPQEPGIGMYSYGLDVDSLDPCGSTNYGKLTNVRLSTEFTALDSTKNFWSNAPRELMVTAVNWNVVRISGGALGFPVL